MRRALFIGISFSLLSIDCASADMQFFRTTQDPTVARRDPDRYSPVAKEWLPLGNPLLVERTPALVIPFEQITAVFVRSGPDISELGEILFYLKDKRSWDNARSTILATFYFSPAATGPLNNLLKQESGHILLSRMDARILAVGRIVDPTPSGELTIPLGKLDPNSLRQLFDPLRGKVLQR